MKTFKGILAAVIGIILGLFVSDLVHSQTVQGNYYPRVTNKSAPCVVLILPRVVVRLQAVSHVSLVNSDDRLKYVMVDKQDPYYVDYVNAAAGAAAWVSIVEIMRDCDASLQKRPLTQ